MIKSSNRAKSQYKIEIIILIYSKYYGIITVFKNLGNGFINKTTKT